MSFENLGLSLLAFFLQLFVVVITIAVCKAKLLYLGINAALFFLISHTTPSYVPLTWLCFAVALLFVLESLSDTHSVWLDRWKRFSTCVLVLDLVVGNLYDDFFTESFLFLIPYLVLNAAAYLGLLIAAWPIPDAIAAARNDGGNPSPLNRSKNKGTNKKRLAANAAAREICRRAACAYPRAAARYAVKIHRSKPPAFCVPRRRATVLRARRGGKKGAIARR